MRSGPRTGRREVPSTRAVLDLRTARRLAAGTFGGTGADGMGLELEWLLRRADGGPVGADTHAEFVGEASHPLPAGGRVTFEPGGQLELSTPVAVSLPALLEAAATDAATLAARAARLGILPVGIGLDPTGGRRLVRSDRYEAMAAYFSARGPVTRRLGHLMMCATAALQVNVGLPNGDEGRARWEAAHRLGPLLAATFANSPVLGDGPSGWGSTRLAVWRDLDPPRTAAVTAIPGDSPGDPVDAPSAWAAYALAAPVMLVRADRGAVPLREVLPFARWVRQGHATGFPTADDLAYHLTTLFPPVRPRGWLELRVLDALGEVHWQVAAAVAVTLLTHAGARREALRTLATADRHLDDAPRTGMADPALAGLADRVLRIAAAALPDLGAAPLGALVTDWAARYPARRRSPADDLLDAWRTTGSLWSRPAPVSAGAGR